RQAKSKSRLARYEEMAAEAEKTRKLDFEEITIPPGPRLGNQVIEAEDLKKGFGERLLIDGLSFSLPPNGIVGGTGPNGVGKTTRFKAAGGARPLDGAGRKSGASDERICVAQNREDIATEKSLSDADSDGLDFIQVGKVETPSRAYVSQFRCKGPDQQ